jgi:membrane associated rhomboid family serine protease
MGFESRDYFRDGSYTANLSAWNIDFTPVVKYLIIANVVVFLLQILLTRPAAPQFPNIDQVWLDDEESATDEQSATEAPAGEKHETKAVDRQTREKNARKAREAMKEMLSRMPGMRMSIIQEWFELNPTKTVERGQVWRLLTSAFCHDRYGLWHILFNMLLLYWFGRRLEQMYGSTEFLLFYLVAAVCSSVAYIALAYYGGSKASAIGASGAIMGVMMLYAIHYPFEEFRLFWFIPVPLWIVLSLYILYDLHPVLLALAGDRLFTGVAHAGHLGGLAFGFLYWRFGWRLEPILHRIQSVTRRRKSMLSRKPAVLPFPRRGNDLDDLVDEILKQRVDEILKKISERGKESLTEAERDILIQAGAKYRGTK